MKHKIIIGLEIILAVGILTGITVFGSQAGTSTDPIVTKSYVDEQINKILSSIATGTEDGGDISISSGVYTPVYATVGQTVYGKEGTEIILRSGKGTAVVPTAEGIPDLTLGQDLANNVNITKNHLLIIPRDDGRGIKVTESAWFLIKGEYTIK